MIKTHLFSVVGLLLLSMAPIEGVNMDPAAHKFHSHPEYAKHMDIECFIVNREQLGTVFKSANSPITQLTNNRLLKSNELYLLVNVTNKGDCIPFGRLNCFVPHVKEPFPVELVKMFAKKTNTYVFRLDPCVVDANDQKPITSYEWENLYCL